MMREQLQKKAVSFPGVFLDRLMDQYMLKDLPVNQLVHKMLRYRSLERELLRCPLDKVALVKSRLVELEHSLND